MDHLELPIVGPKVSPTDSRYTEMVGSEAQVPIANNSRFRAESRLGGSVSAIVAKYELILSQISFFAYISIRNLN